jgi:hypothetical protein
VTARSLPAGAYLDGRSCLLLVRVLVDVVRQLGAGQSLDELRPALAAIAAAAEARRAADAARLRDPLGSTDGWLSTKEYARLVGVSEQAVRKRIDRGRRAAIGEAGPGWSTRGGNWQGQDGPRLNAKHPGH